MTFAWHVDSKVDFAKRPEITAQIASPSSFQAPQKTLFELVSVQFISTQRCLLLARFAVKLYPLSRHCTTSIML